MHPHRGTVPGADFPSHLRDLLPRVEPLELGLLERGSARRLACRRTPHRLFIGEEQGRVLCHEFFVEQLEREREVFRSEREPANGFARRIRALA